MDLFFASNSRVLIPDVCRQNKFYKVGSSYSEKGRWTGWETACIFRRMIIINRHRVLKALLVPVLLLVFLMTLDFFFPYSAGGIQRARFRLVRKHIEYILPVLTEEHRFANIKLYEYTANDGLRVTGTVASEKDLQDLKRLIQTPNFSLPVQWNVYSDE